MGYLASRAVYVQEHEGEYDLQLGLLLPQFAEEVEARKTVVQIYSEMKQADSGLVIPYFEDLLLVVEAGFIREYVWLFLRGEKWREEPNGLRLEQFDHWRLEYIPEHQPETRGKLRVE